MGKIKKSKKQTVQGDAQQQKIEARRQKRED